MGWSEWITDIDKRRIFYTLRRVVDSPGSHARPYDVDGNILPHSGPHDPMDQTTGGFSSHSTFTDWVDASSFDEQRDDLIEEVYQKYLTDAANQVEGNVSSSLFLRVGDATVTASSAWSGGHTGPWSTRRIMVFRQQGLFIQTGWRHFDLYATDPYPKPDFWRTLVQGEDWHYQDGNPSLPFFEYEPGHVGPLDWEHLTLHDLSISSLSWGSDFWTGTDEPVWPSMFLPNFNSFGTDIYVFQKSAYPFLTEVSNRVFDPNSLSGFKLHDGTSQPMAVGATAPNVFTRVTFTYTFTPSNLDLDSYVTDSGHFLLWSTPPGLFSTSYTPDARNSPYSGPFVTVLLTGLNWAAAGSPRGAPWDLTTRGVQPTGHITFAMITPPWRYWIPDLLYPEVPVRPPLRLTQRSSQQLAAAQPQPNPRGDAAGSWW